MPLMAIRAGKTPTNSNRSSPVVSRNTDTHGMGVIARLDNVRLMD